MKTHLNSKRRLLLATTLAACLTAPAWAESKNKLDARVRDLTDYFDTVQKDPDKAVPSEILRDAQGLVIMRNYKAGFIIGVSGGHGVAIARDKTTGKWGPIGFVRAGEGSFGFQAGVQRSDMILALMNNEGIKVVTDPNFKLGADVRATVGPRSAGDQANLRTEKTPVLAYGDTRGLFAGAALETGGLGPDGSDNEDYYGKELPMNGILLGLHVEPTDAAKALADKIEQYAKLATPRPVAEQPKAAPAVAEAPKPLTSEDSVLLTVNAKVTAIDHDKREVTLKGPLGNVVTFLVHSKVQRLDDVQVGDDVSATYYISLAGELRPPTDAEKENPLAIQQGEARAPETADPAGVSLREIKAVTTVVGLDLPTRTVTLTGPRGNSATVRAKSVDNLKKLHLGDTIMVTYTEAFAVAVDKTPVSIRKLD